MLVTDRVWLMKSEPDVYSFADLRSTRTTWWEGVRNYMARNYMTQHMQVGDLVLFYHSNGTPSGVSGLAVITQPARLDESAFNRKSEYFDEKSVREKPRWFCVEVGYKSDLPKFVSLEQIKGNKKLKKMVLLQNSRLSVQPVTVDEAREVLKMAGVIEPVAAKSLTTEKVERL